MKLPLKAMEVDERSASISASRDLEREQSRALAAMQVMGGHQNLKNIHFLSLVLKTGIFDLVSLITIIRHHPHTQHPTPRS